MARRGQSKAFLKALRRKHSLGEFAPKKTARKRVTRRRTARKRASTTASKFGF